MEKDKSTKTEPFPLPNAAMFGPAMGAAAAVTALGTAMAAQAWSAWFGVVTGGLTPTGSKGEKTLDPTRVFGGGEHWGDDEPESGALSARDAAPASKAAAARDTLTAEIERTAEEFQRASRKIAAAFSEDTEAAVETAKIIARANPICAPMMPKENPVSQRVPVAKKAPAKNADNSNADAKSVSGAAPAKPVLLPDDLKAISGIGPKLEQLLNKASVKTYGQIAGWTENDIAAFDKKFALKGRIERDDWIGQARALTANTGQNN